MTIAEQQAQQKIDFEIEIERNNAKIEILERDLRFNKGNLHNFTIATIKFQIRTLQLDNESRAKRLEDYK